MDLCFHDREVNELMIHFHRQWQVTVVFDHYKPHLDLHDIREVHEQAIMYPQMPLVYKQYVMDYGHVLDNQSKRILFFFLRKDKN